MELFRWNISTLQDVPVHQVVIHSGSHNFSDRDGCELHKCVVLRTAGNAVTGETKASDVTKLREVGPHLVFVETMGDTAAKMLEPISQ